MGYLSKALHVHAREAAAEVTKDQCWADFHHAVDGESLSVLCGKLTLLTQWPVNWSQHKVLPLAGFEQARVDKTEGGG